MQPPTRVSRFDVAEIGKPQRTPQGFMRIQAFLTRAGVFAYTRADGTTIREYRPASEVFDASSLASLSSAPVTDLHPTEMVSPSNVRKLRVGHVGEAIRKDGHLVAAHLTVEDAEVIAKVERGERKEISCGYQCRIDATPGEHNGEPYDVVQRDIVYNHAALGPRNWGRAGREVALRTDSSEAPTAGDEDVFRLDSADAVSAQTWSAPPERKDDGEDMDLINVRVDGIEVQVPKQSAQLVEKALKQRDDSLTEATKARDTLQGKFDGQAAELAEVKKKLAAAEDPKRLDAEVSARATLLEQAKRVLPAEHKFDGQTPRQVHEAVLKKLDDKISLEGKSDDYVLSRFDAAIEALPAGGAKGKRTDALGNSRRDTSGHGGGGNAPPSQKRNDAADVPEWQRPLAISKDTGS